MRDAFLCHFPTEPEPSKEERYRQRLMARGRCVKCRRERDRSGRYCSSCSTRSGRGKNAERMRHAQKEKAA